jgi:hypothetical protein
MPCFQLIRFFFGGEPTGAPTRSFRHSRVSIDQQNPFFLSEFDHGIDLTISGGVFAACCMRVSTM